MGKRKNSGSNNSGESWRSKIQRLEKIYGALKIPLWEKYPHLKEVITTANNAAVFTPKLRNANTHTTVHPYLLAISEFKLPHDYQATCEMKLLTVPSELKKTNTGNADYSVSWINTVDQLKSLIERLNNLDHLFMDIEGHNVRSFRGITSLLQIFDDVHRTVYFVDTLALHNEMDRFLPIFINPKIIKVMHGSHNDIKSFEKDFSLYIVGLMDTQMVFREFYKQCGKTGSFQNIQFEPSNISYKSLVNGFLPDAKLEKSETFTDFRQRPLHPAQQQYAFLDVWFLAYVYFAMMTKLEPYYLSQAVDLSKKICRDQRYSFPLVKITKEQKESESLWQLRRLRHYIALKEDMNPEYLCPPSTLIKLRSGGKPFVENVFFRYPVALEKALRGEDGVHVLETVYSDLSIPFPYTPSPVRDLIFCCKHWSLADHSTKDCTLSKAEVKAIKKKHYEENPDKKTSRNQGVHRREKSTDEKRKKMNKRKNESKKRNPSEAFIRRREQWFKKQQQKNRRSKFQLITNQIQERQVSRGIVLPNRKQQYSMLMRQKYREKVGTFVKDHKIDTN